MDKILAWKRYQKFFIYVLAYIWVFVILTDLSTFIFVFVS